MLHPDDQHLAPIERAARLYCTKTGTDPDRQVPVPGRRPSGMVLPTAQRPTRAAWLFVAEELYDLSLRFWALRTAATIKDPPAH